MRTFRPLAAAALAALAFSLAPNAAEAACSDALYSGLGKQIYPITTTSDEAQRYFDQAMTLAAGFNHDEARRFFEKAAALDPKCAMCRWGIAFVLGPNINAPMSDAAVPLAYAAIQEARALRSGVTERERALIDALSHRYVGSVVADRTALDIAFAGAMANVVRRFPNDDDVAAIYAEALMDKSPWNYWTDAHEPRPDTVVAMAVLERILARKPDHIAANHLYIHLVEAVRPELAVAAADRLTELTPDAGHLVHMPSHIYLRVGRYYDASRSNEDAIAADRRFLERCDDRGFYSMMYIPHNYDFLTATSALEGRSALANKTASELRQYVLTRHREHFTHMVELQGWWAAPLLMAVRFEEWKDILREPAPPAEWPMAVALRHYARAIALAKKGDTAEAEAEIAALERAAAAPALATAVLMATNPATKILAIAVKEAKGELQLARGEYDAAIETLKEGVELQDALRYMEPPPWHRSVRLLLARAQLAAGRAADAEATYRADLRHFPDNGWALFGLRTSLERQGRASEAAAVLRRFERSWSRADVRLTDAGVRTSRAR